MKTLLFALIIAGTASTGAFAQEFRSTGNAGRFSIPVAPQEEQPMAPVVEPQRVIDGTIGKAMETGQPLQMINPLAPTRFGNGQEVLSRDPARPRKNPEGVIILGFRF